MTDPSVCAVVSLDREAKATVTVTPRWAVPLSGMAAAASKEFEKESAR